MQSGYQDIQQGLHLDVLADLNAWEGYEFWSAQVEAQMELLADLEHVDGARSGRAGQDERAGDVIPF